MTFVNIEDLKNYIKINVLKDILEVTNEEIPLSSGSTELSENDIILYLSDNTILDNMERQACDLIYGYIGHYYDVGSVFSNTGSTRDGYMLKMVIDIMLYDMWCRMSPDNIPDIIKERYNMVLTQLDKIGKKTLPLNIPKLSDKTQYTSEVMYSYEKTDNDRWH